MSPDHPRQVGELPARVAVQLAPDLRGIRIKHADDLQLSATSSRSSSPVHCPAAQPPRAPPPATSVASSTAAIRSSRSTTPVPLRRVPQVAQLHHVSPHLRRRHRRAGSPERARRRNSVPDQPELLQQPAVHHQAEPASAGSVSVASRHSVPAAVRRPRHVFRVHRDPVHSCESIHAVNRFTTTRIPSIGRVSTGSEKKVSKNGRPSKETGPPSCSTCASCRVRVVAARPEPDAPAASQCRPALEPAPPFCARYTGLCIVWHHRFPRSPAFHVAPKRRSSRSNSSSLPLPVSATSSVRRGASRTAVVAPQFRQLGQSRRRSTPRIEHAIALRRQRTQVRSPRQPARDPL